MTKDQFYDLKTRRQFFQVLGSFAAAGLGSKLLGSDLLHDPRFIEAYLEELSATPRMTEGPFYPYRDLPLDLDNDLVVIGKGTAAAGEVLHVSGRLLDVKGEPIRGATVHLWQADKNGEYIHRGTANPGRYDKAFQGIGKFETDSSGRYRFRTVRPGLYPGRTAHIHFKVERKGVADFTTQLCDKDHPRTPGDSELRNIRDPRLRELVCKPFSPVKGSKTGGLQTTFDIVLDDRIRDFDH